ncbi:MAG: AAA family ATPase [bacterium]
MVLNIEYSQKIIAPEIPGYYYSRDRLLEKILSYKSKRFILITAPAGYGKTSFSVEFFHKLKKELKLWISISPYDNSIENFFLLLALAFENNFQNSNFGAKLKNILAKSQNVSLEEKINYVISSFSSDLYSYLKRRGKKLFIFLDDFHNIDDSDEVCSALNYFLEYLPSNVNIVFISRRDPKKINYPKFLAKNWLGRITKSDLSFSDSDINNFIKLYKKHTVNLDKTLLEEFLKTTEGWVTAMQLLLMTNDFTMLRNEDIHQSRGEIFEYFTNEIYTLCSEEEKNLLLTLSFLETFNKYEIEKVLGLENGYNILVKLYESNVFINKENETYRLHELLRKFLNKIAKEKFSLTEISGIYKKLGNHYLKNREWREDYIALNYLILGKDYEPLMKWIKLNASDKLLLIHSSGLFSKVEQISDKNFKESLEYILLKVNTFVYKDKEIEKALDYLQTVLSTRFSLGINQDILIPSNKIQSSDVNYYIELLMLICNCNFLKEGISINNIPISEHIMKFRLRIDQEIQFIVSLIKSYITSGENSKCRKYILRLKEIFNQIVTDHEKGISTIDENSFIECMFSMLIFFDYGDYTLGNRVIKFILNNSDHKNFDLSDYSQACFALFISYNAKDFEIFFNFLKQKNKEKNQTIFSAYKNQFEFQSILRKFLNYEFKEVIKELEIIKKNTYLKNYIYFIDALILYCYNLINNPQIVSRLINEGNYYVSKTRLLILQLEASLLLNDEKNYNQAMCEIDKIKKENFTLFNQAVILFCECYYYSINNSLKEFKDKFKKFLNMCIEHDYKNYLVFRTKANKLNYVFEYACNNNIESVFLKNLFIKEKISITSNKSRSIKIEVQLLNKSRIFINGKELHDNFWLRPKSKSIFIYLIYRTFYGIESTKSTVIDDIFYNSKIVNYDALVDVEMNKVRKTFQTFLSDIFTEKIDKEVLILKDKKYYITSKNFHIEIQLDVEEFKKLASSNDVPEKIKAFEIYKTDFAIDSFNNWAEDIRENLKFIYSDTIHKLITHFEGKEDSSKVLALLERLVDIDYSDEEIMMKLLSIYNKEKDYRKFRFVYKIYEKRLKKEFDVQPSKEMQKFFSKVTTNS